MENIQEFSEWAYNLFEHKNYLDVKIKICEKQLVDAEIQEPILTPYVVNDKH